jgi:hypothetical protein
MTPEETLTLLSICGIAGTAFNVYLSLRIANSVTGVKLWTRENFVAKDEISGYLGPFRASVQRRQSGEREEARG